MFWAWIKNYMPRGLYGRAAIILILPVLTLQLLVTVVFIQRHFDGVTRSMTSAVRYRPKTGGHAPGRRYSNNYGVVRFVVF